MWWSRVRTMQQALFWLHKQTPYSSSFSFPRKCLIVDLTRFERLKTHANIIHVWTGQLWHKSDTSGCASLNLQCADVWGIQRCQNVSFGTCETVEVGLLMSYNVWWWKSKRSRSGLPGPGVGCTVHDSCRKCICTWSPDTPSRSPSPPYWLWVDSGAPVPAYTQKYTLMIKMRFAESQLLLY